MARHGKGSILKVDPIRSIEAIEAIKALLANRPRDQERRSDGES